MRKGYLTLESGLKVPEECNCVGCPALEPHGCFCIAYNYDMTAYISREEMVMGRRMVVFIIPHQACQRAREAVGGDTPMSRDRKEKVNYRKPKRRYKRRTRKQIEEGERG